MTKHRHTHRPGFGSATSSSLDCSGGGRVLNFTRSAMDCDRSSGTGLAAAAAEKLGDDRTGDVATSTRDSSALKADFVSNSARLLTVTGWVT